MLRWFKLGGEVGVFDATNSTTTRRNWLLKHLERHNVQCAFIESICEDPTVIDTNIRSSKLTSPDYMDFDENCPRRFQDAHCPL